jgi:hypothetical protein
MSSQYNDALVADIHRATNGESLDAEKNAALYKRVAAGDAAAREEMIVGNMPLAVTNVESFIACFPGVAHLRDDLTSAAFMGLTKAVNKMAAGQGPRSTDLSAPVEFMGMWINRELRDLIASASLIRLPARSRYRARAQGQELNAPTVCNVIPERFETPSYQKELEMRDLIESCCTCEEEQVFVSMREAGHTLVEIATAIDRSRMFTQRMGMRLDERIQHKIEAIRNE